ncbi:MAG: right-handed parallel beta-helix repeat-containing protein [Armatimonadetes bacterium]|nr:right-handed parallel beta-helix repeat-containing protein [Armatimonadota bacterium]
MQLPKTITTSLKLKRGVFVLPEGITITGNDIVVDFGGLTLRGTPQGIEPDKRAGVGVRVTGKNITLKNLNVHGYKVGVLARDCPGLVLENLDASDNWKQRLGSTLEKEDGADWMSFHQNEKDEWLGYGAALYLVGCDGFSVRQCKALRGQCGLMLTRCNHGLVAQNNFSFLSAIGLGMYRSSHNKILQNKIDWCVRGYSHGVYNRGQDSAGILIYEQSSENVFAYNSVTHGGDGFFLWAGQTTMDTGRGGCDDNLVYGNDFSHAPTNGIEATFSRNAFVNNVVLECWHGVWGGYSYDTKIVGNVFGFNAEAVAIEHGRDNVISENLFHRDLTGINLWKNATQDPNWAYVRKHETTSRDYDIAHNRFVGCTKPLNIRATDSVREKANTIDTTRFAAVMQPSGNTIVATETDTKAYQKRFQLPWSPTATVPGIIAPAPLPGAPMPFLPKNALRGRRYILVDEWGPYDFERPLLWPRGEGIYEILGPKGKWRLVSAEGATLSQTSGSVPGEVRLSVEAGRVGTTKVELEYLGEATRDSGGTLTPKNTPVRFGFSRFFAPIAWDVTFYPWSKAENPADIHSVPSERHLDQVRALVKPLKTEKRDRLDYAGSSFGQGIPSDHFYTYAEGSFTVPAGAYLLDITTDDGCRLSLDDKPILSSAWKYQGPTLYTIPVTLGGKHKLIVEHFQIDGYATLKIDLRLGR